MEQQQDLIADGSDTVETVSDGDTEASEDETSEQKEDTEDLVENDDDKTDSVESSPSTQDETATPYTTKVAPKPRSQSVPASRPTTTIEEPEALCAHEPFDPELCTLTVTLQFLPRAHDARMVILGLQSHSAMPIVHFLTAQAVRPLPTVVEDAILKWAEGLPALQTKLAELKANATPVTSSPTPASRTGNRKGVAIQERPPLNAQNQRHIQQRRHGRKQAAQIRSVSSCLQPHRSLICPAYLSLTASAYPSRMISHKTIIRSIGLLAPCSRNWQMAASLERSQKIRPWRSR